MDSGGRVTANGCNGNGHAGAVDSKEEEEGFDKGGEAEDEETNALLAPAANGGLEEKRQKGSRRKVQWNDCNGNKLVEVMEFEPSDTSDSEDDYDHGLSSWKQAFVGCAQLFCCLGGRRSCW